MPAKSLGLIQIQERTIEHDLTLLARVQEFSAELLRVALIGISAIGFVVSRLLFPGAGTTPPVIDPTAKALVIAALIMLAISAAAALLHRYCAVDSVSWHLQAMRRYVRNDPNDAATADHECKSRHTRFKVARGAIACSALSLGLGAVLLVIAIVRAMP